MYKRLYIINMNSELSLYLINDLTSIVDDYLKPVLPNDLLTQLNIACIMLRTNCMHNNTRLVSPLYGFIRYQERRSHPRR